MTLIMWRQSKPRGAVAGLKEKMDRLLDHFRSDDVAPFGLGRSEWRPAIDVAETETEFVVEVEAPGIEPEDIDVSIREDVVTIRGRKREDIEEKGRNWCRVERRYGAFSRTIHLPGIAETDNVEASAKSGVVTIHLPKEPEQKTKRVEVKVE